MPWRIGKGESNQPEISTGEDYQCDCSVSRCPCTRWFTIPAGRVVPTEVRCPQCLSGDHSG